MPTAFPLGTTPVCWECLSREAARLSAFVTYQLETAMTRQLKCTLLASICLASASWVGAQTQTPAEPTDPSAASSPHQRSSTKTPADEAPTTDGSEPESSSTRHQRQATRDTTAAESKAEHEQMMKECMSTEQAKDSTMSKEEIKKTCKDQMKKDARQSKGT